MRLALMPVGALLWLSGCGDTGRPLPAQRERVRHPVRMELAMDGGLPEPAWGSIEGGVLASAPGADWRWVMQRPSFTFLADPSLRWSLAVHLTQPGVALKMNGAERVVFRVNGEQVGIALLDHEGRYDLKFPAPPEILKRESPVRVTMDFDPCAADASGLPHCALLHSVGFVQEAS